MRCVDVALLPAWVGLAFRPGHRCATDHVPDEMR